MPITGNVFMFGGGSSAPSVDQSGALLRTRFFKGASITATKGNMIRKFKMEYLSPDGVTAYYYCNIDSTGFDSSNLWTIKASIGSNSVTSYQKITEASEYFANLDASLVVVNYPIGYTCIAAYEGEDIVAPDTSGTMEFLLEVGTESKISCYKSGIERAHYNIVYEEPFNTYEVTLSKWLTFSSPNPFEMVSGDGSKIGWDGTIEYSTDGDNWNIWSGTTALSSGVSGDKNVLYVRGSNNTVITGENASSTAQGWHFSAPEISIDGNIATLLDWETLESGTLPTLNPWAFALLFAWSASTTATDPGREYLKHSYGLILPWLTLSSNCYRSLLQANKLLIDVPALPATILADNCYNGMFQVTNINVLHDLPAIELPELCYRNMYAQCGNIMLSETQTGDYQTPYRIPSSGTGVAGTDALYYMFRNTGGTFIGDTPSVNVTYYTSNTVLGV